MSNTIWSLQLISNWFSAGDGILLCGYYQDPSQQNSIHPSPSLLRPYGVNGAGDNSPWGNQEDIKIVGCHALHQVATAEWGATPGTGMCHLVVGSGHTGDGADVFAQTGGNGTSQSYTMFPSGLYLPQGVVGSPNVAHIDIYGTCYTSGLKQRAVVTIYYTNVE